MTKLVEARPATSRVRVLIALFGLDQHETAAVAVAALLRDAGIEVVYLGRFQTPASIALAAAQEDVDVVGISCHSWEYRHYVPELVAKLDRIGVPLVLGGSVLTESDADELRAAGVARVYGSGTGDAEIVSELRELARTRRANEAESREVQR
jgi:methylmalonyl-CoA mutase C-terminal domain/subunit